MQCMQLYSQRSTLTAILVQDFCAEYSVQVAQRSVMQYVRACERLKWIDAVAEDDYLRSQRFLFCRC